MYDNITYLNITSHSTAFYHSRYQYEHSVYLSNPWDASLNATVDRVSVQSYVSDTYDWKQIDNYILVTKQLNWNDALIFCEMYFNASLALITNDEELESVLYLRNNMSEVMRDSDLWIALTDQQSDGYWKWYGYDNSLCDSFSSANCINDPHWDRRRTSMGESNCAYLVGGITDHQFAFLNTNCQSIRTPFICDNRVGFESFPNLFNQRTEAWCNYYETNEFLIRSDRVIFNDIRLGTNMKISFDIHIHNASSLQEDEIHNIFYLTWGVDAYRVNAELIPLPALNLYKSDHDGYILQIAIVNGVDDIEYINIDFDPYAYTDGYHRFDILVNESLALLKVDGHTHYFEYIDLDYTQYISYQTYLNYETNLTFYMSHPIYPSVNASIRNVCINSNRIRNSSIWYSMGDVEDHEMNVLPPLNSIYDYDDTYSNPIFYYKNKTIIIFDDYIWYKYIEYDVLYQILKQKQAYPYYDTTRSDSDQVNIETCSTKFGTESCNMDGVSTKMKAQQFTQDEFIGYWVSSDDQDGATYLSVILFGSDSTAVKTYGGTHIDHRKIEHVAPYYAQDACIATNHTHVFIINKGIVIIDVSEYIERYEADLDDTVDNWALNGNVTISISFSDSHIFNLSNVGCAVNGDNDIIYIFGGIYATKQQISNDIYKYYIHNDSVALLTHTQLAYPIYNARAILSTHNLKIYLYGGVSVGNHTDRQIFRLDDGHEILEEEWIEDGGNPYTCATFNSDHKIIMKYDARSQRIEYLIPELVSIDFTPSTTTYWRYNTFVVNYIFWDYNYFEDEYIIQWDLGLVGYSTVLVFITDDNSRWCTLETLNATDDIESKCNTEPSPPAMVSADSVSFHAFDSKIVILPHSGYLPISYVSCSVEFLITPPNIIVGDTDRLWILANPSAICKKKPLALGEYDQIKLSTGYLLERYPYVAWIKSDIANLNHYIFVSIDDNEDADCQVCNQSNVCTDCEKEGVPLHFEEEITDFTVELSAPQFYFTYYRLEHSLLQDLEVSPHAVNISVNWPISVTPAPNVNPTQTDDVLIRNIAILCSVVMIVCIGCVSYYFWNKNKNLKQQIQMQKENTIYLSNPMVIGIGIASYASPKPTNVGIIDIDLTDLDGIDVDMFNLKKLCSLLKYDLYPRNCHTKLDWTQKEVMNALKNCAKKASESDYDSIIFISSGHGFKHNILTHDYQCINKNAIHRIFSVNYPSLRKIPRVFIYDVCDGAYDKQRSSRASHVQSKNVGPNDIILKRDRTVQIWDTGHDNPDYKLVTIHGANVGFQSKLNSIDGSYLIREFVVSMKQNMEHNKDQFFGDMMDDIQERLHARGIQQIINIYNNNTRYIKFAKNEKKEPQMDRVITDVMKPNVLDFVHETKQQESTIQKHPVHKQYSAINTPSTDMYTSIHIQEMHL